MSARKITRHDMKHDEFVSTVGRMTMWVEDHLGQLAWAAGGILVAAALVFAFWSWRSSQAMKGEAALAGVVEAFGASVGEGTGTGTTFPTAEAKYRAVLERADQVIRDHGSTPGGERARYYRGLALYEMGDLDGARQALEEFVSRNGDGFLAPHARRKIGVILERQGNLAEACEIYRDLSEEVELREFPTELALIDLGRCLDASGQTAEAIETYRRIVDDHPDSTYAGDAQQRLLELEG